MCVRDLCRPQILNYLLSGFLQEGLTMSPHRVHKHRVTPFKENLGLILDLQGPNHLRNY